MKKKVTNLIDNISKCRDLMTKSELKEVVNKIYIFECVTNEVQRQMKKWLNDKAYELDFLAQDLYELSDEIAEFVKDFDFKFKTNITSVYQNEIIDAVVIDELTSTISTKMFVDEKLRHAQRILSYYAIIYVLKEKDLNILKKI